MPFFSTATEREPPSLSCPTSITLETDPGQCSANVSFSHMINATDNCDQNPSITCNPMSGSSFNVSADIVTCAAEDASGNIGLCNFTLSVIGEINETSLPRWIAKKKN